MDATNQIIRVKVTISPSGGLIFGAVVGLYMVARTTKVMSTIKAGIHDLAKIADEYDKKRTPNETDLKVIKHNVDE